MLYYFYIVHIYPVFETPFSKELMLPIANELYGYLSEAL